MDKVNVTLTVLLVLFYLIMATLILIIPSPVSSWIGVGVCGISVILTILPESIKTKLVNLVNKEINNNE